MVSRKRYSRTRKHRYAKKRSQKRFYRKTVRAVNAYAEKKMNVVSIDGGLIQTGWQVARCYQSLAQGTGKYSRIGNRIMGRYVKVKFLVTNGSSGNFNFRFCVLRPRTNGYTNSDLPSDRIGFVDIDKFHVVYDKMFNFHVEAEFPGYPAQPTSYYTIQDGLKEVTKNFTFKHFKRIQFDDNSTSQCTNDLWLCFLANDSILPSPTLYMQVRATFIDI